MNGAAPSPIVPPARLEKPFQVDGPEAFSALALELFMLHATHNAVYREYLQALTIDPGTITTQENVMHRRCSVSDR